MRPLSLAIAGLTSFRNLQEIDFSDLDLFVITGPTGSGKSSILDAITFALYGKVARVNSHELRELISHGAADMRVRLEFQVDGAEYRVARRMSRTKHEVSLERIDGSSIAGLSRGGTKAVNERLEEIVGLDFSAFTKAVLLPQGAFHEFLSGDKAERRRILTRLLDLNRYERAGQAARREAARLDAIVGEREALISSNYADATKEQLRGLQEASKAAASQQTRLEQARDAGRRIAQAATEARQTIATLTDATRQLEEALDELDRLARDWPTLEAKASAARQALTQANEAVAKTEKGLSRSKTQLGTTVKRVGDSALLARLDEAAVAVSREQQELAALEASLAAAQRDAASLVKNLRAAESDHRKKEQAANEGRRAREHAQRREQLARAIAECAERAAALAGLEERLGPAKQDARARQDEAELARKQLDHLQHEHAAVVLRTGLSPGDHCPVCDSIIETLPEANRDTDALLARAREVLEKSETRARKAEQAAAGIEAQRRAAAAELKKARTALPKKVKDPSAEEAAARLDEAAVETKQAEQAEAKAQVALQTAAKLVADVKTRAATAAERVQGLVANQTGAKKRLAGARRTLVTGFGGKLPREIEASLARRREQLDTAEQQREQAERSLQSAREAREKAQATNEANTGSVSTFDKELAEARVAARFGCDAIAKAGEAEMLAMPKDGAERAEALTIWHRCCDDHLATASKTIRKREKEVSGAAEQLGQLATKAGMRVTATDSVAIEAELEQAVKNAHGAVVEAKKDVETMRKRIKERKQMEEAIAADRHQRTLHTALARDLRSDHLLAWVLEESMNQLADQASIELMRISDERYSLIADGGNFDVVDHNNADEKRSVGTLSGGETFLASLSLALALSAGLRELGGAAAGRLDAIYIDEGFGALDAETLDVVVDALERLREGDRVVGVITHVPTLAERIPSGLVVEKKGGSSEIRIR